MDLLDKAFKLPLLIAELLKLTVGDVCLQAYTYEPDVAVNDDEQPRVSCVVHRTKGLAFFLAIPHLLLLLPTASTEPCIAVVSLRHRHPSCRAGRRRARRCDQWASGLACRRVCGAHSLSPSPSRSQWRLSSSQTSHMSVSRCMFCYP